MPEQKAEKRRGCQTEGSQGRDDTCGVCGEKPGLCGPLGRHSLSRHASDRLSFASRATFEPGQDDGLGRSEFELATLQE